ncbi:hypothetical protein [Salinisphaera sp. LB1]|uniref:hypothetical protein n=1 Tax=Salinisphaera sp. LB1 TaxID=2183911 RepID=UPI000D708086|nr:hypothetical protein [Salinisphaera sp. LB1]AWN15626.1 hypothetical protein SALB1_1423 [Salinisphaera sp. LB1]
MDRSSSLRLAAALIGASALWSGQALAQSSSNTSKAHRLQAMQQQLQALKSQLATLKQKQHNMPAEPSTDNASTSDQASASSTAQANKPKQTLTLGGAFTAGYKLKPDMKNHRSSGDAIAGIAAFNVHGTEGKLSYGAEYRWSPTAFADSSYLRYGWAAYDFGKHSQIKGGMFYVPFGNLRFGYQTFWGNLTYYAGFTDNQAAGLGYKYENGPWRLDVDAFKNDDLEQHSLYGSNPFDGYQQVNGGNVRAAYTFNQGTHHSVQVSAAVRGGELQVGEDAPHYGTRWAATAAVDAALGPWTLQGQYVDYRYNIPAGRSYNDNALPTDAITMENYGFAYQMPASGQIFAANVARTFKIGWGALHSIQLYDNYAYLMTGGSGRFNSALPGNAPNPTGDIQFNAVGADFSFGILQVWADVLTGKNAAMTFDGPSDGSWNTRYNLQMGLYFNGDVIKN